MSLKETELVLEKKKLNEVSELIDDKITELGKKIFKKEEELTDFKKFVWEEKTNLDEVELRSFMTSSEMEAKQLLDKDAYFKKLVKIKDSPYFGSIIFEDEDGKNYEVYISLTYLTKGDGVQVLYDWRAPISSLFYDYEVGPCSYQAPKDIIKGTLKRKRQYKIKNGKLIRVFDNSLNIDDELLQEVLATESSEKIKNIVNTIQQEQNSVIRNVIDKALIVQGIAGSGKTSVALHRIAFLLYKIPKLTSDKILIFSPNDVFSEYISDVLPELGENNTLQTTFNDYLTTKIKEYKKVESFIDFIANYYTYKEKNIDLIRYKQSDSIIKDLNDFVTSFLKKVEFKTGIVENNIYEYSKEELNDLLKDRYSKLPLFERIEKMALRYIEKNYKGSSKKEKTYHKLLIDALNIPKDFKKIFALFLRSKYFKWELTDEEIRKTINKDEISYEDALLFVYLKGLLEGFPFEGDIEEIVIDEAQDYSYLQYLIIFKVFKRSSFTILGDVNQTINPYYKYESLEILTDIFKDSPKYIELNKTYRSSSEIIDFTNKILGLEHVSAIRSENKCPVLFRTKSKSNIDNLLSDINMLKEKYKSIAIVTKDDGEASLLYDELSKKVKATLIDKETKEFKKELVVIPTYMAKGLEFDSVIVYNSQTNKFRNNEKNLLYVACTRAQHQLVIYN